MSSPLARPALEPLVLSRDVGYSAIRSSHRRGEVRRIRPGAYSTPRDETDEWEAQRLAALAHAGAVRSKLRCPYVLSHQTAALLHGCWTGPLDGRTHVTQSTRWDDNDVRGLRRHYLPLPEQDVEIVDGAMVTSLERTILDCARTLHPREALCVADSGFRILAEADRFRRAEAQARMEEVRARLASRLRAMRGFRGVVRARAVVAAADGLSESPGESRLRWVAVSRGMPPPVCQLEVPTPLGCFFLDLGWRIRETRTGRETVLGEEYDGRSKYLPSPGQQPGQALYEEKRREDALRQVGVVVMRRVSDDLKDPDALFASMSRRFPPAVARSWRPVPGLFAARS